MSKLANAHRPRKSRVKTCKRAARRAMLPSRERAASLFSQLHTINVHAVASRKLLGRCTRRSNAHERAKSPVRTAGLAVCVDRLWLWGPSPRWLHIVSRKVRKSFVVRRQDTGEPACRASRSREKPGRNLLAEPRTLQFRTTTRHTRTV